MSEKKAIFQAQLRKRRKMRIRKKISGSSERPRLSVFRSARHISAQVIDDNVGKTLVSASSFEKGQHKNANTDVCNEIGKLLAKRCMEKNIDKVVFDKNGNKYHGRVQSLAQGARDGGLLF